MNRAGRSFALLAVAGLVPACSGKKDKQPSEPPGEKHDAGPRNGDNSAAVNLPPAAPLPDVPLGLPPLPSPPFLASAPTPDLVSLGELMFWDARLSSNGQVSCATCHVPADNFSGATRQPTAGGKPNLRRAPSITNLAWQKELGWDGRSTTMEQWMGTHVRGQMGDDLATSIARVGELPMYKASIARAQTATMDIPTTARRALESFVLTRYAGASRWDRVVNEPVTVVDTKLQLGQELFDGKAQCGVCHVPPLYTDGDYHRIGLIAVADEGRGRVDKSAGKQGAFRTPTLRGAAARKGFFHDASAPTLTAAIDWHLAGGVGQKADKSIIDPALTTITLSPDERAALQYFVESLTEVADAPTAPALP